MECRLHQLRLSASLSCYIPGILAVKNQQNQEKYGAAGAEKQKGLSA
jgi:hypothetical protein